ncbi:enolase C-terminal domain-like protein [Nonomuraea polychroma]|uniref:enolase C-terminal domain-like protein n=1 Tax=Nonomuraea polychroma TaxID=46176 RepID=UPI003D8FE768
MVDCRACTTSDPLWFEEPIRPEYIPAWGHLRSQLGVPPAIGESLFLPQDFLALLTAGGADIVQPDVCVVGGLAQMRRIAAMVSGPVPAGRRLPGAAARPARLGRGGRRVGAGEGRPRAVGEGSEAGPAATGRPLRRSPPA